MLKVGFRWLIEGILGKLFFFVVLGMDREKEKEKEKEKEMEEKEKEKKVGE